MITRTSLFNLLLMIAGFALWGVAFNVLYGTQSLGCELGWHRATLGPLTVERIVLTAVWALLLAAHVALFAWLWREPYDSPAHTRLERFVGIVSVTNAGLGLLATLVIGSLVVFLSPCAP